ncbi:hypothetical protein AB837_00586 [bacterium AB1]|nr:hypothetical protein AB837_00586 [bacterium AB1]
MLGHYIIDSDNVIIIDNLIKINVSEINEPGNVVSTEESENYCLAFLYYMLNSNFNSVLSCYMHQKEMLDIEYLNKIIECLDNVYFSLAIQNSNIQTIFQKISNLYDSIKILKNQYIQSIKEDCKLKLVNFFEDYYLEHIYLKQNLLKYLNIIDDKVKFLIEQDRYFDSDNYDELQENMLNIIEIITNIANKDFNLLFEEKDGYLFIDGVKFFNLNLYNDDERNQFLSLIKEHYLKDIYLYRSKKMEIYCFSLTFYFNYLKNICSLIDSNFQNGINRVQDIKKPIQTLNKLLTKQKQEDDKKINKIVSLYIQSLKSDLNLSDSNLLDLNLSDSSSSDSSLSDSSLSNSNLLDLELLDSSSSDLEIYL